MQRGHDRPIAAASAAPIGGLSSAAGAAGALLSAAAALSFVALSAVDAVVAVAAAVAVAATVAAEVAAAVAVAVAAAVAAAVAVAVASGAAREKKEATERCCCERSLTGCETSECWYSSFDIFLVAGLGSAHARGAQQRARHAHATQCIRGRAPVGFAREPTRLHAPCPWVRMATARVHARVCWRCAGAHGSQ